MKTTRIDDYICINVNQIVVDECDDIINADPGPHFCKEDEEGWDELVKAAKVMRKNYYAP